MANLFLFYEANPYITSTSLLCIQPWRPSEISMRHHWPASSSISTLVPSCRINRLFPVELGALFMLLTGTITIAESSLLALRLRFTADNTEIIANRNTTQASTKENFLWPVVGANLNSSSNIAVTASRTIVI